MCLRNFFSKKSQPHHIVRSSFFYNNAEENYYEILNVKQSDSFATIKKHFHKLSLQFHPDKPGGDAEIYKKITTAYDVLSDEEKRIRYNIEIYKKKLLYANSKGLNPISDFKNWGKKQPQSFITPFDISDRYSLEPKAGDTFYLVGKPILIKKPLSFLQRFKMPIFAKIMRNDISAEEILNSFPKEGRVELFANKLEVDFYIRGLRKGNFYKAAACYQSAYAKVKLRRDLPIQNNAYMLYWQDKYNDLGPDGSSQVVYALADITDIEMVSATLHVKTVIGEKKFPQIRIPAQEKTQYRL